LCQLLFTKNLKIQAPWTAPATINWGKKMSHNVPAVYDGLTARIEKCVAFLGLAKCAGVLAWE
jgi:hypothetical protein